MNLKTLYDGDREVMDDQISVILTRPACPDNSLAESVNVADVVETMATQDRIDSPLGGSLDANRRTFTMWRTACESLPPFSGYEIEKEDGTVWVVRKVDTCDHGRRFRCECVQRQDTTSP